jgi:hypothetical protein
MKNSLILLVLTAVFTIGLSSCNKIKNRSKKLQNQPLSGSAYWSVKSLKIDGQESAFKGEWLVSQGDIYDTIQTLDWTGNSPYGSSTFEWQFQDKAKKFQFNHRLYCEECDGTDLDSMDYLASALTGKYDVEKQSKKCMTFVSTQTSGFAGKEVVIEIEGNK